MKSETTWSFCVRLAFKPSQPEKIEALIDLVDHDLGYRLYEAIERTKRALSDETQSGFRFAEAAATIEETVARSDFQTWIAPEVRAIGDCIDRLLGNCNVNPEEIDAIFMTGGSSFVPAIRSCSRTNSAPRFPFARGGIHIGCRRPGDP